MQAISQADMMEATRLTREGRLQEAMALLQGTSRADPPAASDNTTGQVSRTSAGGTQPLIDMVPPSAGSGGAWTAPSMKGAPPDDGDVQAPPVKAEGGTMSRKGGVRRIGLS